MKDAKKDTVAKSHDGKVVSIAGDKLTSTCGQGKEHHHTVANDAKVTCDGKASKLSDLKAGTSIRMTTCKDDENKVTAIDSGKHVAAASHC
jgi:hypothetical protein